MGSSMARPAKKRKLVPNSASDTQIAGEEVEIPVNLQDSTKENNKSMLLSLPNEIKQRIWIMAVTEDAPITPIQLKERSNKFLWSKNQIVEWKMVIGAVPKLAAVQLAKVCRAMYEEVALTNLFYQYNTFDLSTEDPLEAITYLVALTDARLKAIRHMRILLSAFLNQAMLFTLLRICDGIQLLEISVYYSRYWRWPSPMEEEIWGSEDLVAILRGSKRFVVTIDNIEKLDPIDLAEAEKDCEAVKEFLGAQLKLSKSAPVNIRKLRDAKESARLDVHGEGRLGEDKKPGWISSRTRQGVKCVRAMNPDGTFQMPPMAKYDSEGELNWHICEILRVRETESEDETPKLEFYTKCRPYLRGGRWERGKEPTFSWECSTALTSLRAESKIVNFYKMHPTAVGLRKIKTNWPYSAKRPSNVKLRRLIREQDAMEAREKAMRSKGKVKGKVKEKAKSQPK